MVNDDFNPYLLTSEHRYIDLIIDAKRNLYSSRFIDSWNGDYKNRNVIGTMKPLHYELLKTDDEFKYFLRTQLNDIGWLIYKPSEMTQIECKKLLKLIESDLNRID